MSNCGMKGCREAAADTNRRYSGPNALSSRKMLDARLARRLCDDTKTVSAEEANEDNSQLASRKYTRIVQMLGFNAKFSEFKIQNIVGSCDVKFPIRLEGLAYSTPSRTGNDAIWDREFDQVWSLLSVRRACLTNCIFPFFPLPSLPSPHTPPLAFGSHCHWPLVLLAICHSCPLRTAMPFAICHSCPLCTAMPFAARHSPFAVATYPLCAKRAGDGPTALC
jgi:hypothetical protein